MLTLVERANEIKSVFYEHYSGFPSKHYKPIDLAKTKEVLAELYREQVRLQRHIIALKLRYKGQPPLRRIRTLLYYQKVIDKSARDLEMILRSV